MKNFKKVILGISGGIAAYKVPELISRLRKKAIAVETILTKSAAEFVTPLTLREVSQNPVHTGMFDDFQWNVEHIALAKKADLIAVIPATANIIGKIANGIADDLLTATVMASKAPKLIAPAMNSGMYESPAMQRNLQTLHNDGYQIVGPDSGQLLCGDSGIGRLVALEELEAQIERLLSKQDLAGLTIMITAGGTREPIDPVRYIGNQSSGKMGHALAEAAFKRGAKVILISTVETAPHYSRMETITVQTTAEMFDTVLAKANTADIIIKAAAPADFRPQVNFEQKIKKTTHGLQLDLSLNPDILAELGRRKTDQQFLVGFAAETQDLRDNALDKLTRKKLDMIIGNLVGQPGTGMGADNNRVTIYTKEAEFEIPELPKVVLADQILDMILEVRMKSK